MSERVKVRHKRTGEEAVAYRDPEGLWIDDVEDPGYASRESDYEIIG